MSSYDAICDLCGKQHTVKTPWFCGKAAASSVRKECRRAEKKAEESPWPRVEK